MVSTGAAKLRLHAVAHSHVNQVDLFTTANDELALAA
jgi:hypothetical protein